MNEQMMSALELNIKRALLQNYIYNPHGQRKTVTYDIGDPVTRRFDYDIMGRLINDNKEDGQSISYKYDEAGNLIETSYSGGHVVHYTHDALNRLETVTDLSAGASAEAGEHGTTKYTYDKVGNRKSMTYPNETIATYEYDNLNRLIYLENKGPDGVISSYRYTLGPAGNRLKIEEHNGDICDYSYDKLYRLTRESRTGEHSYSISYTYDAFGNREEMNAGGAVTTYNYDDNDRLLEESGPAGVIEYDYDKNGNTISKEGPDGNWIYEWNVDNKLISAKLNDNDKPEASYQYDLDGERVKKTTPEGSTHFLIDKNNKTGFSQALRETDQSNTELVAYTFGDDLISQKRTEISYYHYDGLGSTRVISSNQAEITDTFIYQAFGSILSKTGSTNIDHLFTGESYDFNLGYYYLRARYMDPAVGGFNTSDPYFGDIVIPYSLHRYLYAYANPIGNFDPSGQFTILGISVNLNIRSILSSISTTRYLLYIQVARLLNVTIGGLTFLTTRGRAALNVLANTGMRGVQALQTAFLRAQVISQSQSSSAANWTSHRAMREAMNKLLTGVKYNLPNIQWHHLVSQSARNIARFGESAIYSVANALPIPARVHRIITNFYISSPEWVKAQRYRRVIDWMVEQPWERQYEIGLQIFKQAWRYGVITFTP